MALLFHNLMTAGRRDDARAMLEEVTAAVRASGDVAAQFALELAESGLMYADGEFPRALEMVETALRSGLGTSDDTRGHLTAARHAGVDRRVRSGQRPQHDGRSPRCVTADVDRSSCRGPT